MISPFADGVTNFQIFGGVSTDRTLLSCVQDGSLVDLWNTDDGSGRQLWQQQHLTQQEYLGSFYLYVCGGVSEKRYLSCTQDGTTVDLWYRDDGSGRQRWKCIGSLYDAYVNIVVAGGVSDGRRYLSCTEDGSKVDLWYEDDGSGRQRWKFIY